MAPGCFSGLWCLRRSRSWVLSDDTVPQVSFPVEATQPGTLQQHRRSRSCVSWSCRLGSPSGGLSGLWCSRAPRARSGYKATSQPRTPTEATQPRNADVRVTTTPIETTPPPSHPNASMVTDVLAPVPAQGFLPNSTGALVPACTGDIPTETTLFRSGYQLDSTVANQPGVLGNVYIHTRALTEVTV
ncbi:hypothetical protein BKA82DRAFT_2643001 [Pisolithus tinctorius]|nr:hypothetical protein BKA82DRAFT_2643001 [Pisolithus tinctorius]